MSNLVVISRKWNKPKISMIVTNEELSFAIGLGDFMEAVKLEVGARDGLGERIDKAAQRVVDGIKSESTRIME